MSALEGRVAVVTGAGRGIGRAIAMRLGGAGATVVVSSRTGGQIEEVVAELRAAGSAGTAVVADAGDRRAAAEPVRVAVAEHGRLDILVCNVGHTTPGEGDPYAMTNDAFERSIDLNLNSAWWTTSGALPHLRDTGDGRITYIGSGASKRAGGPVAYTAAKHGLVGLTRALAAAVAGDRITVNCVCPGWTNTTLVDWEGLARRRGTTVEEAQRLATAENLQRRILEPEEVAAMVAYLASPEAGGITGQVISVDGGYKV